MSLLKVFQIERPWGNFREFIENSPCTIKILTVKPNETLSLQSHAKRAEFWHIISGVGTVEIGEIKKETRAGDEHEIPVDIKHRLSAGSEGLKVLEVAIGDFDEEDIIHYEDKYGRA